ncbi:unnamed protein product [Closterium sp. NIES-53]
MAKDCHTNFQTNQSSVDESAAEMVNSGPHPVDPLPPQGPAPSGVSEVDPPPGAVPGEVAVDSGAARGTASGGAELGGAGPGGAELGGAETRGAEPGSVETGGAEPEGVQPGGAASEGADSGGAEPQGAALSGGSTDALQRRSPQQLREWFVLRARFRSGATGAGGAGIATGAGVTVGTTTTGPGGARPRGTGAAGTRGVGGAGAGDPTESGAAGAGGSGADGAGAGGARVGGTGVGGAGVGGTGAGGAGARGAGVVDPGGACPPPDQSQPLLQPASPLPAPSPYTEQSGGLTERREPASRRVLPVCTACRVPRSRPPPIPSTHAMTLRPSSVPLRVPLPPPPESSLLEVPDPKSNRARAARSTVSRLLATAVTDPSFESAVASALVNELLDFAAACHLDYASALVAESATPPSVGGECALGTDVLEDRQEDFECLTAAVPHFASMLLAPEGDPDAPDIPSPRSYAEAITGTYVDEVPPPRANIVNAMWIFRMKRPSGSLPAFKARYVALGFTQRQGVDYFQTFSPTPKMTTLRVLLHVAAQRDYELHSLNFSTAFLQGSLHEEIWQCRPPGFTGSFPAGTQWSLRRPVYGLRQAPREWHDTLRTTLAALGFAPSTADPSLFLRTDTSLPSFYVLVYVNDLVFATADTEALTFVKSELQNRHTYTDLGPSALRLPVLLATAHSSVYQPFALSSTLRRVRRAEWSIPRACGLPHRSSQGYTFSLGSGSVSWRSTCSSLVVSSSCEAEIYAGAMAAQELHWLTYLLTDLGEQHCSPPVLYVDNKAMIALRQEHRLEHRTKHIALRYFFARELQQRG